MVKQSVKCEAIVLKATPFQDYHLLADFFTEEFGLLRLICPYARAKRSLLIGHLIPLNHLEIEFQKTKSDLSKLLNAYILNPYLDLRNSLELLETGCMLLKTIFHSQLSEKPAPLLFSLLQKYLKLLPEAYSKEAVLASFRLKLLRHEGLIREDEKQEKIDFSGNVVKNVSFSDEEMKYIWVLSMTNSSQFLRELNLPKSLGNKIEEFFYSSLKE